MSSNRQKINNTFLQKKRSQIKSKDIETSPKKQIIKLKTGPWDEKEDKLLKQWVEKNGAYNWTKCAEYMKFRTAKQCREHWKNNLDYNLKVGQWTSEEDLLIMKFYKKYESWRKMIPMFEGRTENSIKNRFFSQLRKIVVKKRPTGRKEYGTKYGLEILKNYLDEGIKQAELKYYEENKNMTKEGFESYMLQIENSIKNRKKGKKFIDLNIIKKKNLNVKNNKNETINIDEDEEENKILSDEEKDENLETFNTTTKNKRGRKKATLNNMFKTTKNIDEPITREETTIPKDKPNFTKKKSKIIIDEKNIIKEEKIIEEENKIEKEKETEKINNGINNNNTNNILTRKMSRKLSKKLEEEKNKENINTKKENAFEDKFVRPQRYDDEFRVTMPTLNNSELQRSESIILNDDDNNNNKYKEKVRGRYNNGTSTNIENALKGKNINPIYSFAPQ